MIQLPQPTENLLINAAHAAGQSPLAFLDRLLKDYLQDLEDAKTASAAYREFDESGESGIPFEKVMADNGL